MTIPQPSGLHGTRHFPRDRAFRFCVRALRSFPARCLGCLIVAGWLSAAVSVSLSAADLTVVTPFLENHCFDCHADGAAEGGLDLNQLGDDLDDPGVFARWERIHDRVAAGEMPPRSRSRSRSAEPPAAADRDGFLKALGGELTAAHRARRGTVLRRLNRQEYENTLNDLFGTHLSLADRLPEDNRAHEFDNVGAALGLSMVQMQRYLECMEVVLNEAMAGSIGPPERKVVRASYASTQGAEQWLGKIWLKRDDGAVVFFKEFGYPSGMLREANVTRDGWYTIRVTGYAFQSDRPVTFAVGATTFARGLEQPTFGYFSMPPGPPKTIELRAWIPGRYMITVTPQGITDRNNEIRQKGVAGYQGPGLAIQSVAIEGPLVDEFPSRGSRLLFDGLKRVEVPPRNPAERRRPGYVPKFEIVSTDPRGDVTPVLARVATRAFRRPLGDSELTPYLDLFQAELTRGSTFEEALRTAVTAIFCAPDFLYLREGEREGEREREGPLDDHALAARLSYFLTRTLPDDELLAAAASGTLSRDRAALLAQAERLLDDPRSVRFVEDFTDAWLNLRTITATMPDGILYPEFDPYLQDSMLKETRAFFRTLVDDNLGVRNVVRSDFAMLNERLAEHYGIAGVTGPEIRSVRLGEESVRGGLLSQASVLKVSANGTNTSPVVRGVWVLERILGVRPSPPPPGVPGIEPDIRGASTLREQLAKHRNLATCRSCHQQFDPLGFALESFDPVGGWRERFRSLGGSDRVNTEVRGSRVRYTLGPPVDSSGKLTDGRTFAGFREFRDLLAEDDGALAQALSIKLLTFATGRQMGFTDRPEIASIVARSGTTGHGVRDLIRLVVASEIFRTK
jgi:hypothetical protein